MPTEVILPRVDMDMAEGKIAHWYVKNGDSVAKGQVLFEIETDKAAMEVDSPADGVIQGIQGEIGVTIPVGQVVGWILAAGESMPEGAEPAGPVESVEDRSVAPSPAEPAAVDDLLAGAQNNAEGRSMFRATPLARSLARERGMDLALVQGSGPQGRVLARDVLSSVGASIGRERFTLHLNWWKRGAGTPLLMIHGFAAEQGSWRPLVQSLGENLPVMAVDLPNHGKSGQHAVDSLRAMAQLVLQRLDEEGVGAFHVLGHSLGGGVSLALAQLSPDRVRSLTLLAPAGLGPDINEGFIHGLVQADSEASLKKVMGDLFHDPSLLTGSFIATAFQQLQAPGRREALIDLARAIMPQGVQSESMRGVLDLVAAPIKLIWGAEDRIISSTHSKGVPGRVALHVLPEVGHLPQVEASALVAELLRHQVRAAG